MVMKMEKVKLIYDDREDYLLSEELRKLGVICNPKRLKVGDYINDELSICFEYKTIDDFCGSIIDGRIERQIKNMLNNYKKNFVVINGNIKNKKSDIHKNSVIGMIGKIISKGIFVIILDNEKDCAFFIKRCIEREQKERERIIWKK